MLSLVWLHTLMLTISAESIILNIFEQRNAPTWINLSLYISGGQPFYCCGPKKAVIFVAGRTHNSSKGMHNIYPYYFFFSVAGLGGRTKIARGPPPLLYMILLERTS